MKDQKVRHQPSRSRVLLAGALVFVAYVVTAKLGLSLDAVSGFATFVWPPAGIALAALLLFGRRLWPAVAAGAFVANLLTGASAPVALGIAVGNTLEALLATWALERLLQFRPSLSRIRDVIALAAVGAGASTAIAATIGVASLYAGGRVDASGLWSTWRAWWIGDSLGDLIVAPFLLVRWPALKVPPRKWILAEGLCLIAATVLIALFVFDVVLPRTSAQDFRSPYLIFPPVIWAALRFGPRGTTGIVLLLWIASIAATVFGLGPFAAGHLSDSLSHLQAFMAVVAITAHLLGAAISERDDASAAREEFIAVAAHELRTPLTSLNLQLAQLKKLNESGAVSSEVLQKKTVFIQRQGTRLIALVENLLDVSRLMTGRLQLKRETLDLRDLTLEVVDRCQDQAQRVQSAVQLEASEPIVGSWDRVRMEQVLTNLLANAIKFGGGKPIHVSLSSAADAVTLKVRDQGVGIPAEEQQRIFERFERAAAHRQYGGLGLGLWISEQIIRTMGGTLSVRSDVGKGAEFTISLPRSTEPSPPST